MTIPPITIKGIGMRESTKVLMKTMTAHIAKKIATGKADLQKDQQAKQAFRNTMKERLKPILEETRRIQREEGFAHYLDCVAGHKKQDENFAAGLAAIGGALGHATVRAICDDLGVPTKRLGNIVKAFRRKQPAQKVSVSKVPTRKKLKGKPKLKIVASNDPVKMDRKAFAAHLKSFGNDLRKIKAKDLT
jgi:hypothetical protein